MSSWRTKKTSDIEESDDELSELSFHSFSESEDQTPEQSDEELVCYKLRGTKAKNVDYKKKLRKRLDKKINPINKKGLKLGNIPKVMSSIDMCDSQDLGIICKICSITYRKRKEAIKKLKEFDGFVEKNLMDKKDFLSSLPKKKVLDICEVFGVDKYGTRRDQAERIVEFLQAPEDYFLPIN